MKKIVLLIVLLLFPLSLYSQRIEEKEYSLQKEYKGVFEIKNISISTEKNLQWENVSIKGIFTYQNENEEIIKKIISYSIKTKDIDGKDRFIYDLKNGDILETFSFYFKEGEKDTKIFISITKNRDILILSEE